MLQIPIPAKLEKISPSGYTGLLQCPLRACWQSNWQQRPPIPAGPAAQLGSVIHRLLEAAGKGQIAPAGAGAEWDLLLSQHEAGLAAHPETAWMVPLRTTAFGFEELKLLAIHKAAALVSQAPSGGGGSNLHPAASAEVKLCTPDGKIAGKVDFLAETTEGTIIRDYKTGSIFENSESGEQGAEPELKADYIAQLELYAGIYQESTGRWPATLEIVPLSGAAESVPVLSDKCLSLLQQARAKLDEINALLSVGNAAALAKPTGDTCKYCGFRPACLPYRQASGMAAAEGWPIDVASEILAASPSTTGTLLRLKNGLSVLLATTPNRLSPGTCIALFNLKRLRSGTLYAWRGSRLFIESRPPAPPEQTATSPGLEA